MKKVFLLRHGKTRWNKSQRIMGNADPSLSEEGIKEAEHIIKKLENKNIKRIISSDLKRAKQTAKIVQKRLKVPLIIRKKLREVDYGVLANRHKDSAAEDFSKYHIDPTFRHPGGESFNEMGERVRKELTKLPLDGSLIVTHAGCIRSIHSTLKNEPLQKNMNMKVRNAELFSYDLS